jgi:hypothetical protein
LNGIIQVHLFYTFQTDTVIAMLLAFLSAAVRVLFISCTFCVGQNDWHFGNESFIPSFSFQTIVDEARNKVFYDALKCTVRPNQSYVLDVGSGMGLISMMAGTLNARKVYAVEQHDAMSNLSAKLIALNNLSSKVHVINKESYDLSVGMDGYNHKADIVVSDTLDPWILGEGFLDILGALRSQDLISSDAVVIPSRGTLYGQLVYRNYAPIMSEYASISGFDFSAVEQYLPGYYFAENAKAHISDYLSEPIPLFEFDFQSYELGKDAYVSKHIPFSQNGTANAIMFYFDLCADPKCQFNLTNAPGSDTYWTQMIRFLDFNLDAVVGSSYHFIGTHILNQYVFAYGDKSERIVRVQSFCAFPVVLRTFRRLFSTVGGTSVSVSASATATASSTSNPSGSIHTPMDIGCNVTDEKQCWSLFDLQEFADYNYWVGSVGQTIVALVNNPSSQQQFMVPYTIAEGDSGDRVGEFNVTC